MRNWNWNIHSYWTDYESLQKITEKAKKTEQTIAQIPLEEVYDHQRSDFNYSFIADKPKKEFPSLGTDRKLPDNVAENLEQLVKDKAQEGLGVGLLRLGIALAIPEGSELILPWTWADEAAGVVLIGAGLVLIFGESIF